jgi:hypothetical protein
MRRIAAVATVILAVTCLGATAPPGVKPAPEALVKRVSFFLNPGYSLDTAFIAPSQAQQRAIFFAARVIEKGKRTSHVGVWLISGTLDDPGVTLSVNVVATICSVAPEGAKTKAEVTMSDPPASDLEEYVQARLK